MNKPTREALDAYYVEAESWSRDRQEMLRASRRIAWRVAVAAGTIALLEALALILLMPLKTVVPYTLLVDRNTGFVQVLKPLDPAEVSADAALTQSLLVQYVIARESFDIDMIQSSYRKVTLWSAEKARASYVANIQASNPESPFSRYPRRTVVETRVKSVSSIGRNVALVRFETQRRDAGGQVAAPQAWAAIVRYRFSGEPMHLEDRFENPLGFKVVRYRRDAEALPPPSVAAVALPSPPLAIESTASTREAAPVPMPPPLPPSEKSKQ